MAGILYRLLIVNSYTGWLIGLGYFFLVNTVSMLLLKFFNVFSFSPVILAISLIRSLTL